MAIFSLKTQISRCAAGVLGVLFTAEPLFAASYYVSASGDNANPGTQAAPWRTIGQANALARAGDTIFLRAGTYAESIRPLNSGTATASIHYSAYPGERVTVTGSADSGSPVYMSRDYISVENLSIHRERAVAGHSVDVFIHGNSNVLRGCRISASGDPLGAYGDGARETGVSVSGRGNVIERNEISGMSLIGILLAQGSRLTAVRYNNVHGSMYDAIRLESSGGVLRGDLIEGNTLSGSAVSDGIQFNGNFALSPEALEADTSNCGVIIRGNTIYGNAENGVDLKGACSVVVEGNRIFGNRGDNDGTYKDNSACGGDVNDRCGGRAIMHGSGASSRDIIVRRNVVYDNSGGIFWVDDGWMVYNNTVVGNNRDFTGSSSGYLSPGKPVFSGLYGTPRAHGAAKNNLIGDHFDCEVATSSAAHGEIDGNLYFYRGAQPCFTTTEDPWYGLDFAGWQDALTSLERLSGKDASSRTVSDPRFINVPPRPILSMAGLNFALRADSQAIDAGVALAHAQGSGSGSLISVDNARYFHDGFGTGDGDTIVVGGATARIKATDVESGTLTLDRDIRWTAGMPVNLPFSGAAPDIGAMERDDTEVPPQGGSIIPVRVTASSSRFDDEGPQATLDDDLNTHWSSVGAGQYLQFDLGEAVSLARIDLAFLLGDFAPYSTRRYSFEIQVSSDGTTFLPAGGDRSGSGTTEGFERFAVAVPSARYVRIVGWGSNVNMVNNIREVRFY